MLCGGNPIGAFSSSKVVYSIMNDTSKKLEVIFKKYTPSSPALIVSPFKFKAEDSTYLFLKLLANGTEVSEYGMVMSVKEKTPDVNNGIKVPFDKKANENGYYGYQVINETGVYNQPFYIRPYAIVNGEYIYGDVSYIEPSSI